MKEVGICTIKKKFRERGNKQLRTVIRNKIKNRGWKSNRYLCVDIGIFKGT